MPRLVTQKHFDTNRAVTEFMRDNGVDDKDARRAYAENAMCGMVRYWFTSTMSYSITHDGKEYIIRVSEEG